MKDIILTPPILLGVFFSGIVYFVILFNLTKNRKFASFFENIVLYIFVFIISGANFFPLDRLDPADIGDHAKGFFSGLSLLFLYGTFFILFRGKGKQILGNFLLLFKQPFLGLYLGLIAFSIFWSENPLVTAKATVGLIFFSMFAVHFARKFKWQELAEIFRWNSIYIAIFSIFSAKFATSIGLCDKGWCGGFGHPIDLGYLMSIGFALWILQAISNPKYRTRSICLSALCLIVMQFTNSAGALLVFATLTILVLTTSFLKRLNFSQAFIFFIFLLSSLGTVSIWLISNLENFLQVFDKDVTLTGRIPLWTMLFQTKIQERLWFGFGYNAFWQRWLGNDSPAAGVVKVIIGDGRDWVAHAHNGYIDIILNIGLVGLVIFMVIFLINVTQTIRLIVNTKRPESFLPLIILTFVFMTNLSNSPIIIPSFNWFLFVVATVRLNLIPLVSQSQSSSKIDIPLTPRSTKAY